MEEEKIKEQNIDEVQERIHKWKELTSNLESIKEHMFGETASTPIQAHTSRRVPDQTPPYSSQHLNKSDASSDTDQINPLESHWEGEYVIDLTKKMKSPEKVDEFPESSFTPIKEDEESEYEHHYNLVSIEI